MEYNLTITEQDYQNLRRHLFPGDGKEAVAIALCGRQNNNIQKRLLIYEIVHIPYEHCSIREDNLIKWSTKIIIPFIERAAKGGFGILKIHSHPTGYESFSETDNKSDKELFESIFGWMDDEEPHASAIMLPDGKIFGRIFDVNLKHKPINKINVVGDDLLIWTTDKKIRHEEFELRTIQAFGEGTTNKLAKLHIGVVGCSGTGSPLIEQLVRLGVGKITLIDPDIVEKKNLNRIYNSTMEDALLGSYKVDVLKKSIDSIGLGTEVQIFKKNIYDDLQIINNLASCDFIFGCVDSIDGRHLLNLISTFYLIPYFDLGVKLNSDGQGGINQIMGTVHYIKPGGSSLRTRGVYTNEELRAATMHRTNIKYYEEQKKSGYIVDIVVNSPAVISINTQVASMAVNEFLARIHPYRYDENKKFAITRISFTDAYIQHGVDGDIDNYLKRFVGRGDLKPLLNLSELV